MDLPGPFPVGRYARKLEEEMKKRARVQLMGEVTGVGRSKKQAFFELRDREGAVPCTMWLDDFERSKLPEGALRDGAELVVAGGPDYYRGGSQASPSFSFRATHMRLAGEGDLLAQLEALRKQLQREGLFELQKQLRRPRLPKTIGVVTAETGAARRDLLAGLARRGWAGTVVWGFAPVQDRRAAPAIAAAIQELAARPEVEAIVVTRGGGSLADLWAFCDETLCRTVALLRVPVISAVGHERDSTLIDDVAAVACSTPTHAAEAAVPLDCLAARRDLQRAAASLRRSGEGAVEARARHLGALARGPARALQRQRSHLNQKIREIRAASERGLAERTGFQRRIATVVLRRAQQRAVERAAAGRAEERRRGAAIERSAERALQRRRQVLERIALTLRAHDPERTLERGYALAESAAGEPVTTASAAAAAGAVRLRFADGRVRAEIEGDVERET
ncbi:MAG TPA: exodeoxyribonuclease VII large subunit [Solirubrobacterales bacterium]|nr:exodeoxyribonuclease VII large subunit [Solirubrobacterales bacterium]